MESLQGPPFYRPHPCQLTIHRQPSSFYFVPNHPKIFMEELIISAEREEKNYWKDLWSYRELLYFLAWRDILVRYKQTTVGVAWAVIRPIINIAIFSILLQKIAPAPFSTVPLPLFLCAGTLTWGLFATAFSDAGNSLIGSSNL